MMRIGYDAKRIFHNTTGLGNYSRDLVRILATYYPDNQYFLYNPKTPKVKRLQLTGNMTVKMPGNYFTKLLPALWRSKFITKDIAKDKIDIFHGLSGELPVGIAKTPAKSIVTIHDLIFMRFPELYKPIDRKIYTKKFKKAAQDADKVVAISKQTKQDIIDLLKIPEEKIQVIYQGCHQVFKQEYQQTAKQALRQKYHLPEQFLLNVGTIEERKNALTIVKAIQNTGLKLVLVGRKTAYAQQILEFIAQNKMQDQVFFLEGLTLEELALLYQMASIFLYPSIFEGFGIPIIEALFSKTPVITNKTGVFPEAAGPFAYYLNDVKNPDEMKNLIFKVLKDSNLSQNIKNSYAYAQANFSDAVIAAQYHDLYEKLQG